MKNSKILLLLSCLCIIGCIATIYVLDYNEIAYFLIILILLIDFVIIVMNDIKFNYMLIDKKVLIYADVTNSKLIKLFYGADNKVINKVYRVIKDNVKKGSVKRKYSNHFVILTEYKNKNEIISLINKINEEVKQIIDDDMFVLSLKYGIQICNDEDYESNENKAAIACNKAKREALTTYTFYDEVDIEKHIEENKILDNLVKSLKNNDFDVYYQPKYDFKLNKIIGSEALVRLKQNNEIIPAKDFIEVAEKYGFTVLLDKYVLKEVCKKIKELKKNKIKFNTISINVSRNTLCEKSMMEYYDNILNQYDVKKDEIELEITERDPKSYDYNIHNTIHELCKKFNVSIDDFGIGNSSLSMLTETKIKTIKIDRKFIADESEFGRKILNNIIKLAHDLGFQLVAEGVETEEQYNYLKSKGCNVIQGYYYSKPLSFSEFEKKLMEEK